MRTDLLAKILNDELKVQVKRNPFRYRSLYEMLKKTVEKYNVRLLTA
ncbi:hypothetical protein DRN73_07435, partial [Candidatus Pacearchaeota archaeon]